MATLVRAVSIVFVHDNILTGEVSGGLQGKFDSKIKECEHF